MANAYPAWPREYVERAHPTDVAEMQAAMRLASRDNIDYCDALARIRTFHGSQSAGSLPPTTGSAGCLLDPPSSDDFMDADGNPLDYASVSRGR